MTWIFALVFVTIGAALQRVTGLGFTLVSGPLLVLVLGAFDGILLANVLSAVIAVYVLAGTFRHTRWRTSLILVAGVVLGIPLGAIVVYTLRADVLMIVVGALTSLAVLLAFSRKPLRFLQARSGAVAAGIVSGFSNVTAGVGGAALAMYGSSTRMPMTAFIPTVQVVALATNALSIAAKPHFAFPLPLLLGSAGCVAAGLVAGSFLVRVIDGRRAQTLALVLALLGSLAATVRGIVELVA